MLNITFSNQKFRQQAQDAINKIDWEKAEKMYAGAGWTFLSSEQATADGLKNIAKELVDIMDKDDDILSLSSGGISIHKFENCVFVYVGLGSHGR